MLEVIRGSPITSFSFALVTACPVKLLLRFYSPVYQHLLAINSSSIKTINIYQFLNYSSNRWEPVLGDQRIEEQRWPRKKRLFCY